MIKSLLAKIFSVKEPKKEPETGEVWEMDNDNPFETTAAKIIDVKNGWVLYKFIFQNNTLGYFENTIRLSTFKNVYKYRDPEGEK